VHDMEKTLHDLTRPKHGFDIVENMSRWQKRDTIWGNPNSVILLHKANHVMLYLKRDMIFGEFLCLFKLKTILKTGWRILERESAICRPGDWRMEQFPPIFTSFYMF